VARLLLERHPTARHVLRRAGWYLVTFLLAVAINFFLPRLGKNNPIDVMLAKVSANLDHESARQREEAYLKEFGLVQVDPQGVLVRDAKGRPLRTSLGAQFLDYLAMTLRGDLGCSILQYPKRVSEILRVSLPWTLALQIPTITLGWIVGNLLGALAAYRRGIFDRLLYPLALLLSAVPAFCLGLLLVWFFGIELEWLPVLGGYDTGMNPSFSWAFLQSAALYYVLPFCSVFLITTGGQAIGMRSMCIYELGTDYIKYAKLLGIREQRILLYTFRNAMLPQLTGLGLALGGMVGGALVTELIFSYPGIGMTVLTAIQGNDYPVIAGCTLLITVSVLMANFSVDILVGWLDPRIRVTQTQSEAS
jgi:peptide/nickel transport system permease protein